MYHLFDIHNLKHNKNTDMHTYRQIDKQMNISKKATDIIH